MGAPLLADRLPDLRQLLGDAVQNLDVIFAASSFAFSSVLRALWLVE